MSAPEVGPQEKEALWDIVKRSDHDLETHEMRCVFCRTPGVVCGTGANIAATNEDARRALGLE
ncbi:hypothetical protein [Streptomyces niveus]|uniref:hypothetical protein n=1 Tax=Streptomyces niveus TaxID=193462 RepID=UPI001331BDDB|nr:hypothetical protein [Streptomyces niveus]